MGPGPRSRGSRGGRGKAPGPGLFPQVIPMTWTRSIRMTQGPGWIARVPGGLSALDQAGICGGCPPVEPRGRSSSRGRGPRVSAVTPGPRSKQPSLMGPAGTGSPRAMGPTRLAGPVSPPFGGAGLVPAAFWLPGSPPCLVGGPGPWNPALPGVPGNPGGNQRRKHAGGPPGRSRFVGPFSLRLPGGPGRLSKFLSTPRPPGRPWVPWCGPAISGEASPTPPLPGRAPTSAQRPANHVPPRSGPSAGLPPPWPRPCPRAGARPACRRGPPPGAGGAPTAVGKGGPRSGPRRGPPGPAILPSQLAALPMADPGFPAGPRHEKLVPGPALIRGPEPGQGQSLPPSPACRTPQEIPPAGRAGFPATAIPRRGETSDGQPPLDSPGPRLTPIPRRTPPPSPQGPAVPTQPGPGAMTAASAPAPPASTPGPAGPVHPSGQGRNLSQPWPWGHPGLELETQPRAANFPFPCSMTSPPPICIPGRPPGPPGPRLPARPAGPSPRAPPRRPPKPPPTNPPSRPPAPPPASLIQAPVNCFHLRPFPSRKSPIFRTFQDNTETESLHLKQPANQPAHRPTKATPAKLTPERSRTPCGTSFAVYFPEGREGRDFRGPPGPGGGPAGGQGRGKGQVGRGPQPRGPVAGQIRPRAGPRPAGRVRPGIPPARAG